jgi:hypothetical protein
MVLETLVSYDGIRYVCLLFRRCAPVGHRAAAAGTSAAGQLGSSIGAALLSTVAASATAGYLSHTPRHATAGRVAGTAHGYIVAIMWGAVVTLAAAVPVALFVNAPAAQATSRQPPADP